MTVAPMPLTQTKKTFRRRYKNEIKAYSLIALPLAWWVVFFVVAFLSAFVYSFTNLRNSLETITKFTFDNYSRIFDKASPLYDPKFFASLKITCIWTIVMMAGNNFMGLFLSFLLNKIPKCKRLILALLFWPSLVSAVVSSDITKMMFATDTGIVNGIINAFGGSSIPWLDSPDTALYALMIMPFLLGFCTKLMIYYAAILAIPESYYEAARLETNSSAKVFMRITLPLIRNALVVNFVMSLIDGFKILGPMQLITKGGPQDSTLSTVYYIYRLAFENSNMGRACAYSFILFFIILVLTVVQLRLTGKGENSYE